MRFTVLLTDSFDRRDLRLILDAGYTYQAYVSLWDKFFEPNMPPVLEYVKIARLFKRHDHYVLAVLIDNYFKSSLSVAHYVHSAGDLARWAALQPIADKQRIRYTIDAAVIAASPAFRLPGAALRTLKQDFVCCARLGVVKIDRVRHCETALETRIRLLATEIDQHVGSVQFGFGGTGPLAQLIIGPLRFAAGGSTPTVRVYIRNRRLQPIVDRFAVISGLLVQHVVPTGSAKSLLGARTIHSDPAVKRLMRALARMRKRTREADEDTTNLFNQLEDMSTLSEPSAKRRRINLRESLRSVITASGSPASILGKRKRE